MFLQYIEQTFIQEIFGNSLEEIDIIMKPVLQDDQGFTIQSDQKIGIKQIHILQILCPENCQRCVYLDRKVICTTCKQSLELNGYSCSCQGFYQNSICVEKCLDGYISDQYKTCQKTEIIRSIGFQQNLRKSYFANELLELEFDLKNSRSFQIDIEVQINNFQDQSSFKVELSQGQYMAYLNLQSQDDFFLGLNSMSQRDCESEQFCSIYNFESQIITIDQSQLNLYALIEEFRHGKNRENEAQNRQLAYWKLINLNINILEYENQVPIIENCQEIVTQQFEKKCLKCQAPFISFNGKCVDKCPLIKPTSDEICFDSELENTKILELQDFKQNYYNYFGDYYHFRDMWFHNKELLQSGSMQWRYYDRQLDVHYGITIQAKIIFIDYKNDTNVKISLDDDNFEIFVQPNGQEYIGGLRSNPDSIVYINQFIQHNNTDLELNFKTDKTTYLTNLVLLIHQCAPYCKSCTGPKKSECLDYRKDLKEFDAIKQECNIGYYETRGKDCKKCIDWDCLACNELECLQCNEGCKKTKFGTCICN